MLTKLQPICLFWDHSNLFLSLKRVAKRDDNLFARHNIRIDFKNLFSIASAGRPITKAFCVGSVLSELVGVWKQITKSTGIMPELHELGVDSGREQGVDECLQVSMLRCLTDITPPQVVVLLTGDGAGFGNGVGFHSDLQRMYLQGWGVEVVSWDLACAKSLKTWVKKVGTYIKLEDYYDSVTFIQGGRLSRYPNLANRPVSLPRAGVQGPEGELKPEATQEPPNRWGAPRRPT